jgi:hypothetical protein
MSAARLSVHADARIAQRAASHGHDGAITGEEARISHRS